MSVSMVLPATTESILLLVVPCGYSNWLTNLLNPGVLVASKPNDFLVLLPIHISSVIDPLSVPAPNILTWLSGLSLPGQAAVLTCPAGLLWVGLSRLVFYCPGSATCVAKQASHYVQWSLLGQGGVCFSISHWSYTSETGGVVFRQRWQTPTKNTTNITSTIKHIDTRMRRKEGEGVWVMKLEVLAKRASGSTARKCWMKSTGWKGWKSIRKISWSLRRLITNCCSETS